jgi:hypothetical protein
MRGKAFVATLVAVAGLTAGVAEAQSPHFVRGPTLTVETCDVSVAFKAAGLGGVPEVEAALVVGPGSSVQCVCVNRGRQVPNSANKQTLEGEIVVETLAVRNGQTTGTVSFVAACPADFICPPGQTETLNACRYHGLTLYVGELLSARFGDLAGGPVFPTP